MDNYEKEKLNIINGNKPIFQLVHHKGLQAELDYLNEKFPGGTYAQGLEYSYIGKFNGKYVGIRDIPYGSKELLYYFSLVPTTKNTDCR